MEGDTGVVSGCVGRKSLTGGGEYPGILLNVLLGIGQSRTTTKDETHRVLGCAVLLQEDRRTKHALGIISVTQ